jgi:hypothetical protein
MIEHGRIEIGRCDARAVWKARRQRSGENAGARGGLKYILRLGLGYSFGEIGGI